jgi:hypothetical protein
MLLLLFAATAGGGPVIAPPSSVAPLVEASRTLAFYDAGRTVALSDAGRALKFWGQDMPLTFPEPYDPSDVQSYTFDLTGALGSAEGLSTVTVALEAGAPSGLAIGTSARAPAIAGKTVVFWLTSSNAAIAPADVGVVLTAVTNSTPTRTLQRTGIVQVRQR